MTELTVFKDTTMACWARFQLNNGEPCWISVARTGVLVKRSRVGLMGKKLYKEDAHKAAESSVALDVLYSDRKVPAGMTDPVLSAFSNAILHCSNTKEVSETLNSAVEKAKSTN